MRNSLNVVDDQLSPHPEEPADCEIARRPKAALNDPPQTSLREFCESRTSPTHRVCFGRGGSVSSGWRDTAEP